MTRRKMMWLVLVALGSIAVIIFFLNYYRHTSIRNFNDCVGAGYAVSDTYPLQCTANGRTFVKQDSNPVDEAVANVVGDFGAAMQMVPVNASGTSASQAMWNDYHNLVAPQLLSSWMQDPASAPGRSSSSSWPDHIAIGSLEEKGPMAYLVTGDVVMATNGGIAGEYAVTTTVAVVNGNWMITAWNASSG
jgi:hypothetical protein